MAERWVGSGSIEQRYVAQFGPGDRLCELEAAIRGRQHQQRQQRPTTATAANHPQLSTQVPEIEIEKRKEIRERGLKD